MGNATPSVAAARGHRGTTVRIRKQEAVVRIGAVLTALWLVIGLVAAGQRGYFSGSSSNCAKAGSTVVTVVAGPLNYIGVNPKIKCTVPQPSK
jgi:hypothetical protein